MEAVLTMERHSAARSKSSDRIATLYIRNRDIGSFFAVSDIALNNSFALIKLFFASAHKRSFLYDHEYIVDLV